jgi:hypothetical protein
VGSSEHDTEQSGSHIRRIIPLLARRLSASPKEICFMELYSCHNTQLLDLIRGILDRM